MQYGALLMVVVVVAAAAAAIVDFTVKREHHGHGCYTRALASYCFLADVFPVSFSSSVLLSNVSLNTDSSNFCCCHHRCCCLSGG